MQNWNKFPRFILALTLLIVLCAGLFAPKVEQVEARPMRGCPGGIITQWTFLGDVVIPSTGSGTFTSGVGLIPPAAPYTFVAGNPDRAISFSNWNTPTLDATDFVEFRVDTTGTDLITLNFDYRRSPTGPSSLQIGYSTDGINFVNFGGSISVTADDTWISQNINFSTIPALDNNPLAAFRIYGYSASSAAGTLRFDNVTISEICPPPIEVLINEVAWMGTIASANDEWIELSNPGITDVDITNWRLVSNDGNPDIVFNSSTCNPDCIITAGGYFILERAHDNVIQGMTADLIFFGQIADTGETLTLARPDSTIVDTANSDGGTWPAGILSPASSMERVGPVADGTLSWATFQGSGIAFDAGGNSINGTPGNLNSMFGVPPTLTPSITPSPTNTFTPTPTVTLTPSITPTSSITRSVIINEVAWAGANSSLTDDEWIELYNPGTTAVNITGWSLKSADGTPDITLSGSVPAGGYFLLERDDDFTVSDIIADQIYTGNALSNSGEALTLYDGSNKVIDTANGNGGAWPKGSSSTYGTMERIGNSAESDSAWLTNTGIKKNGKNANGGDILGTPKSSNSPTPTPTPTPNKTETPSPVPTYRPPDPRPIINEILPRPGFDWNQDGKVNVFDEFIEIKNLTSIDITLNGWKLDKVSGGSFPLPNVTLKPGERIVFYSLETNLLLSDGGETVRLINASGKIYDAYTYTIAKVEDRSICRLPDGNVFNGWYNDCIPTPNLSNTREGVVPSMPGEGFESPVCQLPDTLPADFLFAECHGYGANIWDAYYWDQLGMQGSWYIPQNTSKWEAIIE